MLNHKKAPLPPVTVWGLGLIALCGIIALYIAAHAAFITVARQEQAIAAALLIEAGAVVEALTAARSGFKNKAANGGLLISYTVSLSYNLTQVMDNRPGLAIWQTIAFAAGPLSALTFVALALGQELRVYNARLTVWREGQAAEAQADNDARLQTEAALTAQAQAAEAILAAERQAAELAEARRARLHRQRLDRQRQAAELTGESPEGNGNQPASSGDGQGATEKAPAWLAETPESKGDFVAMVAEGRLVVPPDVTGARLADVVPAVKSNRTGRDWLAAARSNGH